MKPADRGQSLSEEEKSLLETARSIAGQPADRQLPPIEINRQERILRLAAQLGIAAEEYLEKAVRAQKAVREWWTPERIKRLGSVPREERPKTEDVIRDLLPRIVPADGSTSEEVAAAREKTLFVLRAPGILGTLEALALYQMAAMTGRNKPVDADALEGVALALAPHLQLPRGSGRRIPADFGERKFDEYWFHEYTLKVIRAKYLRRRRWALKWLEKDRKRAGDLRKVSDADFPEADARLEEERGQDWGSRIRLGAGSETTEQEAARLFLTEYRTGTGDPRPVTEADTLEAVAEVRKLKKRVMARRRTGGRARPR